MTGQRTRMSTPTRTLAGLAAAAAALSLSGCGGAKVGDTAAAGGGAAASKCGQFNLAVNAWVGYEANAAVIAEVAESRLGCTVKKKNANCAPTNSAITVTAPTRIRLRSSSVGRSGAAVRRW